KTKTFHPITQFPQSRRCRTTGQPAANDDDVKLSPVVRTHQPHVVSVAAPFSCERPRRNFCVEYPDHNCWAGLMKPSKMATGIAVYPAKSSHAKIRPPRARRGVSFLSFNPRD